MKKQIKVAIVDSSQDFREMLAELLSEQEDMLLSGTADSGPTAIDLIRSKRPDILVLDLLLPERDGISILRELKADGILPRIIVVSGFCSDAVATQASHLGVDFYLHKPCRGQELIFRIRELAAMTDIQRLPVKDFDPLITEALNHAGLLPNLRGYHYLRDSIRRTIIDRNTLQGVTKILYPELAKQYHGSVHSIERAMRHAIDVAWDRGDAEHRQHYFGNPPAFLKRPTCTTFIAVVADFIESRYFREENYI